MYKPTSAFLKFSWLDATLFDLFVFLSIETYSLYTKIISRRTMYLSYAAPWRVHGASLDLGIILTLNIGLRSFRLELLQADLNSLRRISEANSQWAELASSFLEPWAQILRPWLEYNVN